MIYWKFAVMWMKKAKRKKHTHTHTHTNLSSYSRLSVRFVIHVIIFCCISFLSCSTINPNKPHEPTKQTKIDCTTICFIYLCTTRKKPKQNKKLKANIYLSNWLLCSCIFQNCLFILNSLCLFFLCFSCILFLSLSLFPILHLYTRK